MYDLYLIITLSMYIHVLKYSIPMHMGRQIEQISKKISKKQPTATSNGDLDELLVLVAWGGARAGLGRQGRG